MGQVSSSDRLDAARAMLGLSVLELWFDYIGMGGRLLPQELRARLAGDGQLDGRDHDLLAQALNERFLDRDEDHPLAYVDELEQRD